MLTLLWILFLSVTLKTLWRLMFSLNPQASQINISIITSSIQHLVSITSIRKPGDSFVAMWKSGSKATDRVRSSNIASIGYLLPTNAGQNPGYWIVSFFLGILISWAPETGLHVPVPGYHASSINILCMKLAQRSKTRMCKSEAWFPHGCMYPNQCLSTRVPFAWSN